MWELYNVLKPGLVGIHKEYLIDEILEIMKKIDTTSFLKSLQIMYGNEDFRNPLKVAILFAKGIKDVKLFEFVNFVEKTSGSSK